MNFIIIFPGRRSLTEINDRDRRPTAAPERRFLDLPFPEAHLDHAFVCFVLEHLARLASTSTTRDAAPMTMRNHSTGLPHEARSLVT